MCLSFPVATAFSQQRRQGVSNVGTDAAVDTVTTAAADTAAGTWELVSMTYNGMTVGKEDLEEMGTAMTLDLLEDGTGTMDYDGTVYDLSLIHILSCHSSVAAWSTAMSPCLIGSSG